MTKPRVVFCADDLGLSPGVNEGIERAAEAGLVREASLCVTGGAVEAGACLARAYELGVGLHLSFSLGRALTGPLRGLTDRDGAFLPLRAVLASCLARAPRRDEVEREVSAQLDRVGELGLPLSHLDGHHHVHVFPVVRDAVLSQVRRRDIRFVRSPEDRTASTLEQRPKRMLLATLARRFRERAPDRPRPVEFTGLGLHDSADFAPRLLALLSRPPASTLELMVHPRVEDGLMRRLDRLGPRGERWRHELAALCEPQHVRRVRALVTPVRFADLAPPS